MTTRRCKIILGSVFKEYAKETDLTTEFLNKIDPEGINLVNLSLPHNDTDWRLLVYFKVLNKVEPVIGTVTVSPKFFKNFIQTVDVNDNGSIEVVQVH